MIPIAIGTAQFGLSYGIANEKGQVALPEIARILALAWSAGIDTLDTAAGYGQAETALGELGVSQWKVISKLGAVPLDCGDAHRWARAAVDQSLDRLRVERLDAMLLHRPADLLGPHGAKIYASLVQAKTDGRIGRIGVSIYEPVELENLTRQFDLDLVQAPFNVFDRRMHSSGWMSELVRRGIALHVRSVFLQGLLLMEDQKRPPSFERWTVLWEGWRQWLAVERVTALEAALRFVIARSGIERMVVGVESAEQLQAILAAIRSGPFQVPEHLQSDDPLLINPSRWKLA